ncbi:hypothetical protein ADL00_37055 [Streptomyces sp. AS58]|nr:hypothetical protein ADL00_37055 [Streptomyces sp. AS58]
MPGPPAFFALESLAFFFVLVPLAFFAALETLAFLSALGLAVPFIVIGTPSREGEGAADADATEVTPTPMTAKNAAIMSRQRCHLNIWYQFSCKVRLLRCGRVRGECLQSSPGRAWRSCFRELFPDGAMLADLRTVVDRLIAFDRRHYGQHRNRRQGASQAASASQSRHGLQDASPDQALEHLVQVAG